MFPPWSILNLVAISVVASFKAVSRLESHIIALSKTNKHGDGTQSLKMPLVLPGFSVTSHIDLIMNLYNY